MASSRYRLTMRRGPLPGKVYDLAKSVLTIGREVKNDFVINDAEVSRQHVRLTEQENGWQVEDLASTNGTFVNGQRLSGARLLQPGDVIGLGETVELHYTERRDPDATVMTGEFKAAHTEESQPLADIPAAAPSPGPQVRSEVPSFSIPSSVPVAPARTSGMPTWLWAVGIGCAVLAACACGALVLMTLIGPQIAQMIR